MVYATTGGKPSTQSSSDPSGAQSPSPGDVDNTTRSADERSTAFLLSRFRCGVLFVSMLLLTSVMVLSIVKLCHGIDRPYRVLSVSATLSQDEEHLERGEIEVLAAVESTQASSSSIVGDGDATILPLTMTNTPEVLVSRSSEMPQTAPPHWCNRTSSTANRVNSGGAAPAEEVSFAQVVAALQRSGRLFIIGDSVLRYAYVNFAYYLTSEGQWAFPGEGPRNEAEADFGSWERFFVVTNRRLKHEVCDCRRTEAQNRQHRYDRMREARYYNNTKLGILMAFVMQMGGASVTLHTRRFLNATCDPVKGCTQSCTPGRCSPAAPPTRDPVTGIIRNRYGARPWETRLPRVSFEYLWIQQLCLYQPRLVILNMGRWTPLDNSDGIRRLIRTTLALRRCLREPNRTTIYWFATLPTRGHIGLVLAKRSFVVPKDFNDRKYIQPWIAKRAADTKGPMWRFLDLQPLVWEIALAKNRSYRDLFFDQRHFSTSVVAALNREMVRRVLFCVDEKLPQFAAPNGEDPRGTAREGGGA